MANMMPQTTLRRPSPSRRPRRGPRPVKAIAAISPPAFDVAVGRIRIGVSPRQQQGSRHIAGCNSMRAKTSLSARVTSRPRRAAARSRTDNDQPNGRHVVQLICGLDPPPVMNGKPFRKSVRRPQASKTTGQSANARISA